MKFPRSRRITRRADFQRVRAQGKSLAGRFLVLGYLRDDTLSEPIRLGLITTKKIGNAVTRNRVRRQIRGIIQRTGELVMPGHWIVFIARNAAASASSDQLEKEWEWMLRKASLIVAEKTRD